MEVTEGLRSRAGNVNKNWHYEYGQKDQGMEGQKESSETWLVGPGSGRNTGQEEHGKKETESGRK